jgi:hypothetical protein
MEKTVTAVQYSPEVQRLRKKIIKVLPVKRKGGWVPPEHDSSFINEGARMGIVVPVLPGNILVDALSPEFKENEKHSDRTMLALELGLTGSEEFNVHSSKSFFRRRTVNLDNRVKYLDLSIAAHLMEYLILRADTQRVSPNWKDRFELGSRKFALVEEGEEIEEKVTRTEDLKQAYKLLDKIDSSVDKMKDFLFVYYLNKKQAKKPPRDATLDWLKAEIQKIIDEDLQMFLEIMSDKFYETKLLIIKSVTGGFLQRERNNYFIPGEDQPVGVLDDMVEYLEDSRYQEFRMKLMLQVENSEKK